MKARDLARYLQYHRYRLGHERLLGDDVEAHLEDAGIEFEREKILGPADRVDFLVGGTAVELKIKAQKRAIYRQMERYAMHDVVDGLILVTAGATSLPARINDKPVFVVKLGLTGL